MATAQVSGGYSPPIGEPWGSFPVLSAINEGFDLAQNPNATTAHDVTGIAGTLLPGPLGLGLSAISSALPGGWLDSVLGLGDFSSTAVPSAASGMGLDYTPGLAAALPGTGLWGAVQDAGQSVGSGIGDAVSSVGSGIGSVVSAIASALGLGGQSSSSGDNQGMGQKFGG